MPSLSPVLLGKAGSGPGAGRIGPHVLCLGPRAVARWLVKSREGGSQPPARSLSPAGKRWAARPVSTGAQGWGSTCRGPCV